MSALARHRRRRQQDQELNITAFMNLMVALVPFLLMTLVFERISTLDLKLPELSNAAAPANPNKKLNLELILRKAYIAVSDTEGGEIARIAHVTGQPDTKKLSETLVEIKRRLPDKKDITLLADTDVPYQHIVHAMDTARSYRTVVAASLVEIELFPDIAIGDAPLEISP
jgi:biopolymer transport protein ExbD